MAQAFLAGLIVLWAVLYLAWRFMPQGLRARLNRLHPALRKLAPAGACAACSSCGACAAPSPAAAAAVEPGGSPQRPVIWLSHRD